MLRYVGERREGTVPKPEDEEQALIKPSSDVIMWILTIFIDTFDVFTEGTTAQHNRTHDATHNTMQYNTK